MRIHSIHINNLLSFETFTWEELEPQLNVIVGPNGVGKTNLFHALRAVLDAFNLAQGETAAYWAQSIHQGSDTDTMTISIDVSFTTVYEKQLLCAIFATILCNQYDIQQTISAATRRGPSPENITSFAAWVQRYMCPEHIAWFFHGQLTITYVGRFGWHCLYESLPKRPKFRIDLTNGGTLYGQAEHVSQTTLQNWGSLFAAWRNSLSEQERRQLDDKLTGTASEGDFPPVDFSNLPNWVSLQQGVALLITDQIQIVDNGTLATHRALTRIALSSPEPRELYSMRFVFQLLLERALVFTDNIRLLPQRTFTGNELLEKQFNLSSGEYLAIFLFQKKNGNVHDYEQYVAVQHLFNRMTHRHFDVLMASGNIKGSLPSGLMTSQSEQLNAANMLLQLVIRRSDGDIPLEYSGAGIAETLFLSAVIAGSSGQIILLDEPGLNLSPTMQTTLLSEVAALSCRSEDERCQFLLNTHTPSLVPPDAIDRVSRFTLQNRQTVRQALDLQDIDSDDLHRLRQLLRGNVAARALLFSRGALLLEGDTELAALPVWCPELESQNIGLCVVGGAGNYVPFVRFLQSFAIPYAIIGDGEVLWDRSQPKSPMGNIKNILAVRDNAVPSVPSELGKSTQDFVQWKQQLEIYGIFTLAHDPSEGFEKALLPEIPEGQWKLAKLLFGSNKVARGRFIAENNPCPQTVTEMIQKVLTYLKERDAASEGDIL